MCLTTELTGRLSDPDALLFTDAISQINGMLTVYGQPRAKLSDYIAEKFDYAIRERELDMIPVSFISNSFSTLLLKSL